MSQHLSSAARPWEYSAFTVRVVRKHRPSPGFVRVTLAGAGLENFGPWGLDQRIKLVLPMADGCMPDFGLLEEPTPHPKHWYARWRTLPEDARNVLRTYTPSAIRPERGEIDVDVYIHEPAGPASRWVISCHPSDRLIITGPDVRVGRTGYGIHFSPPENPRRVLLAGDESALPAINNILAALGPSTVTDVLLELADPADDLLPERGLNFRKEIVARGTTAGRELERAVRAWGRDQEESMFQDGFYAWIAGEATATTNIRRHLTQQLGVSREQVTFQGYWKLGGPLSG
ncbi:siderophore-interacting protein [Nesterenkonia halotolerans]|uniref:siderophore-interacting protein n=1 Tax=Nesterenkonia halotolerans TaxID=225325 RepID=UPI003EE62FB0